MKITIEFDTDNAAFEENPSEIESVLINAKWAIVQRTDEDSRPLRDSNGNTVGEVRFSA